MAGGLAVVLSGGGAKGAFQVGVLDALIREKGVDFETAVGTSTGAIQAAAVAQDDIGRLIDFWRGLTSESSIYRKRGGTLLAAITGKDSIYSTGPLRSLLDQFIDDAAIRATGKNLRLAVVNLTNGELRIVGENADGIANWVYASSAMPFFFPPLETRSALGVREQWVDGGVRDVTPLDAGLAERPRAILVVRASARPAPDEAKKYDNLLEIALRSVDLLSREVSQNDIKNVDLINALILMRDRQRMDLMQTGLDAATIDAVMRRFDDLVNRFRLVPIKVIEPESNLYDTLDFEPDLIEQNIQRGREAVLAQWDMLSTFLGASGD
ncbi:patatin-like phospholipase family protein [Erythrobacter rubeus]|uniref:Patatin-like phospholipase family protein n=1 Tax=Erythrobacter rubeus TaxID=2760803 RepID=A0ABR8KKS1_9SPHN|nr:patatin-like phospholipase family protein [Erythrobacter rubeus]MBD2840891.1 patatin-like phospholipase family protein [Erythrobacter rubeus]